MSGGMSKNKKPTSFASAIRIKLRVEEEAVPEVSYC